MSCIKDFSFFLDTRIEFGIGKINNLCDYIKQLNGSKVMIFTDKVLVDIGVVNPVIDILNKNNIPYVLFDQVQVDPPVEIVDTAGEICRDKKCDLIIAIGGGSTMDTAKGASVVAANGGSSYEYLDGRGEQRKEIIDSPVPIIAVPTTSGTGAEVSQYAVITHNNIKDSISSSKIYPRLALIDANFMKNLPPTVTAYTGMDALGHAIEGYTSKIENALTDIFALEAIKLIFENLSLAVIGGDINARNNMAMAALLAGISMSHCGATIPHAMGCPLSGHCSVPHGLSVGVLQLPMMEFDKEELKYKFKKILNYIDHHTFELTEEQCACILIEKVRKLMKDINMPETLKIKNLTEETIDKMVEDAMNHGCMGLNNRTVNKEDVLKIYKKLF